MNQLQFERNIDNVLARADELGIWIICGWTLPIPKAIEYIEKYNTNPNEGFLEDEGKVILSHGGGKITFSRQECDAIVSLIKAAYLGA